MITQPVAGAVVAGLFRLISPLASAAWVQRWSAREVRSGNDAVLTLVHVDVIRSRYPSENAVHAFRGAVRRTSTGGVKILDPESTTPYLVVLTEPGSTVDVLEPVDAARPGTAPRTAAVFVAGAALLLGVLGVVGWLVTTAVFGGDYGEVRTVVAAPSLPSAQSPPAPPPPQPVLPDGAEVWSAVRAPDNADTAGSAVDAQPLTAWSTDLYRQPFGDTKNGIGVVVSFEQPTDLTGIWITTSHSGALVEIRTPPGDDGILASTRVLGSAVLNIGANDIPVDAPSDLNAVLVWVAELGSVGTQFAADFSEIGFSGS